MLKTAVAGTASVKASGTAYGIKRKTPMTLSPWLIASRATPMINTMKVRALSETTNTTRMSRAIARWIVNTNCPVLGVKPTARAPPPMRVCCEVSERSSGPLGNRLNTLRLCRESRLIRAKHPPGLHLPVWKPAITRGRDVAQQNRFPGRSWPLVASCLRRESKLSLLARVVRR